MIPYLIHHLVLIQPSNPFQKLVGHADHVMSIDFHPSKVGLLSSCDSNDEIRLWDVNDGDCKLIFKVGVSTSFCNVDEESVSAWHRKASFI